MIIRGGLSGQPVAPDGLVNPSQKDRQWAYLDFAASIRPFVAAAEPVCPPSYRFLLLIIIRKRHP